MKTWTQRLGIPLIAGLVLVLSACGLQMTTEPSTTTYTIVWEVEGVIVETDRNVEEGSTPLYDGVTPVKSDAQYQYAFTGWSPAIVAATRDQKYVAEFEQGAPREYRVTWRDGDGAVLERTDAIYGSIASHALPQDTNQWRYLGWTPTLTSVTDDCTYTAVREVKQYTVTWIGADDVVIDTTRVAYGSTPTHALPEDTDQWDYSGWSPTIVAVTGDATYQALREMEAYPISDQVLVDDANLNITIRRAYDDDGDFVLSVYYENKTDDMELMFVLDAAIVNGYDISAWFYDSLPAATKSIDTIDFYEADLEKSGIVTVDQVVLYLRVYDSDDWSADDLVNDRFVIYPTGLSEADVVSPARPTSPSEAVLVDDDHATFVVFDTYIDDIWGYSLDVYIENKSTEQTMMFTVDDVVVNGYLISSFWACALYPGSKAVTTIHLSESGFRDSGIVSADKIELYVRIYDDDDDWMADDLIDGRFVIYPTGLTEDEVVSPARPSGDAEFVVLDDESVTFVIIESFDDDGDYILTVFLENKTDAELMFTWDDVAVNGFAIDPYWASSLVPGSKYVTTIDFYESDFAECDIDIVTAVRFLLRIYDVVDWSADDVVNATFTYRP
ncbi:MAG: hypothetical protein WC509_08660 [Candidatus Izemoplasmatales bacterium]